MQVILTDQFRKNFKKRILCNQKLTKKYKERVALFMKSGQSALLHNHLLKGRLNNYWSFSITGDVRLIYTRKDKNTVLFMDIGTHTQVYGL